MKTYNDYIKEKTDLTNMYRCSIKYFHSTDRKKLGEEQQEIDRKLEESFKDIYYKYSEKINKECFKKTGKKLGDQDIN